jgi:hypothetical protein
MKRNPHVGPVCDRIIAQLRARIRALNDQCDLFERIARRHFTEADDIQMAANLNPLIDGATTSTTDEINLLEGIKGIERASRTSPLVPRG